MASNPGIDIGPHWWRGSALTTAQALPAPASWPFSYLGLLMILYSAKLQKKLSLQTKNTLYILIKTEDHHNQVCITVIKLIHW